MYNGRLDLLEAVSNNVQHVLRRVSIRAHLNSSKGIKDNLHHLDIIQNLEVGSLHFQKTTMEEHPILNDANLSFHSLGDVSF